VSRPKPVHATPVLGYRGIEKHGGGWGTPHPDFISYEGTPATTVAILHWHSWGRPTATGDGTVAAHKPGGGYYANDARAEVRVTRLGWCHGVRAYLNLYIRTAPRPGVAPNHKWHSWGISKTASICPDVDG